MLYVNCAVCGNRLVKGEKLSGGELKCEKCGEIIKAIITRNSVVVSIKKPAREKNPSKNI